MIATPVSSAEAESDNNELVTSETNGNETASTEPITKLHATREHPLL
jgi:hypothetical protein